MDAVLTIMAAVLTRGRGLKVAKRGELEVRRKREREREESARLGGR
ncbi:hypothetical protein BVRB_6g134930 [Beta vulgaris subsp. vulgaris]|nr:hypothetical protein BVRB_6g134930 [Beta vulgaris subsp. vulgaris]